MSSDRFVSGPLQPNKKELHSQIGFYLLPPESGTEASSATGAAIKTSTNSKRRSNKKASTTKQTNQVETNFLCSRILNGTENKTHRINNYLSYLNFKYS